MSPSLPPQTLKPQISVVIPVYNVRPYLEACLESVRQQSLEDLEAICVDDGSDDGCAEILNAAAAQDCRFRVIHQANRGYGAAINAGMAAACGDYVGIVDSDDLTEPRMYETLLAAARLHEADLVKAGHYEFISRGSRTELKNRPLDRRGDTYYNRPVDLSVETEPYRFDKYTWAGIYSRDFLQRHQIRHNESPGASFQDNGFWFQTFMYARRAVFLPEPLYRYRRDNPGSSTNSLGRAMAIKTEYDFIERILLDSPVLTPKLREIFAHVKFQNFYANLKRIDESLRPGFLSVFREEFLRHQEEGILSPQMFSRHERHKLACVLQNRMPISGSGLAAFFGRLFRD